MLAEHQLLEERTASINELKMLTAGDSLEACFSQSTSVEPAASLCGLDDFQALLGDLPAAALDQENLRRGFLLSRISTRITLESTLPSKPVLFNRNLTTLAGGLIGLVAVLAFFLLIDVKETAQ